MNDYGGNIWERIRNRGINSDLGMGGDSTSGPFLQPGMQGIPIQETQEMPMQNIGLGAPSAMGQFQPSMQPIQSMQPSNIPGQMMRGQRRNRSKPNSRNPIRRRTDQMSIRNMNSVMDSSRNYGPMTNNMNPGMGMQSAFKRY